MKQVLVFADSHRDLASMQKAIAYHKNIRTVIHCGDHYSDAMQLVRPGYEWYAVKGNCDAYNSDEEYDFVLNEDKAHPILITHGDKYAVKWSVDRLAAKAREIGACAAVFGHTHRALCAHKQGVLLFNPGSVSVYRTDNPSYGILSVNEDGAVESAAVLYVNQIPDILS
jgi:putative phosphoesterase